MPAVYHMDIDCKERKQSENNKANAVFKIGSVKNKSFIDHRMFLLQLLDYCKVKRSKHSFTLCRNQVQEETNEDMGEITA
jgi:hypothetical protein